MFKYIYAVWIKAVIYIFIKGTVVGISSELGFINV